MKNNRKFIVLLFWIILLFLGLFIILKSDEFLIASTKSLNLIGLLISIFSIAGFLIELYIKKDRCKIHLNSNIFVIL